VSWLSRAIDAGGEQRYQLAEIREGLFVGEGDRSAKLTQFWMLLTLSSLIAAGGVIGDSTPAVIGAMIIAPLATPIYGVALATSIGSGKNLRDSILLLVSGIGVNILIGVVAAAITVQRMSLDVNPQITGRTAPTLLDLMVAIAVGIAGSFALTRRDVSNIVAGVAIAISLVPVLAVVGITLAAGRLDLAAGAFLLFLTNVAAILVSGILVFGAARYFREADKAKARPGRRARAFIGVFLVVLLVPLAIASTRTYAYDRWVSATQAAAESWVEGTEWEVQSVEAVNDVIVIDVFGPGTAPPLASLIAEVRAHVPKRVEVRLIEKAGAVTDL
jgi:uncharacterized hydrophobic protein (TIGR00271 family)